MKLAGTKFRLGPEFSFRNVNEIGLSGAVDVRAFGAGPDKTAAENTTGIRAAIDAASAIGGGRVAFAAGTYLLSAALFWRSSVRLVGSGQTVLKIVDGVDSQVMAVQNQQTAQPLVDIGAEGIAFDGNTAGSPGLTAASAVALDPVDGALFVNCKFRNARGYGVSMQYLASGVPDNARVKNVVFVKCDFYGNGAGLEAGGTTYDGVDIKNCDGVTFIACKAYDNELDGFDVRGENVELHACHAYENGGSGLEVSANANGNTQSSSVRVFGGKYEDNAVDGISISNNPAGGAGYTRIDIAGALCADNDGNGIGFVSTNANTFATINARCLGNSQDGISIPVTPQIALLNHCECTLNGDSGIYVNGTNVHITGGALISNTEYGYEEGSSATRNNLSGSLRVNGNTIGDFLFNSASRLTTVAPSVRDYTPNSSTDGDIIASATTITLPEGGSFFAITGTTTITSVTASQRNRVVVLYFAGSLTFTDGDNLRIAGNFSTAAGSTITLVCDGTNWFEVSRSAN